MIRLITLIAAGLIALQAGRCALEPSSGAPQSVPIAEMLRSPGAYNGRSVTFRGKVLDRVSLMGVGGYRLAADDGAAVVVLGLVTAPPVGETATVTGVFWMAASLGSYQAPVVVAK